MSTINITNARKDLYNLVEAVNRFHEPTLIVGKKANAVLISEDAWRLGQSRFSDSASQSSTPPSRDTSIRPRIFTNGRVSASISSVTTTRAGRTALSGISGISRYGMRRITVFAAEQICGLELRSSSLSFTALARRI